MYKLSKRAEKDLEHIFRYSLTQFGVVQTEKYVKNLVNIFHLLVEQPHMGMDSSYIRPELFRYIYQSHTIYYKYQNQQIFIVRILHNKMIHRHYFN
ncbi:type II toxin-antitoxin system RelE/ParE family toxin [Actinobacillus porcinus]|uniref:type II toxin-antitoxin system RelE/ParE family toxin n=1 Tax=Actinobacillus porcinus TaxID=51048 RepID=UPI0023579E8E|nr:type II toxin-antitoxin system RelE/ParE family toxin [Actinobacillus porcinus]